LHYLVNLEKFSSDEAAIEMQQCLVGNTKMKGIIYYFDTYIQASIDEVRVCRA
jgi:hypothetical protein